MRLFRFSRFFCTRKAGHHGGDHLLGGGLAATAGDGHHRHLKAAAPGLGQVAQGREGVVDGDDGYFGRDSCRGRALNPPRQPAALNILCSTSTPRAPRRRAAGMNSWPSWRSPVRGMKSSPVWQVRESVLTPQKVSQAPWCTRVPPVAVRISSVVKLAPHQPWYSFRAWATSSRSSKWRRSAPQI